jgi:acyl-CoA synthetase (AMP-forming)/AMP-acid ligase II
MAKGRMLTYHIFEDRAGKPEGDNIFLIFENRQWTYTEFYYAIPPIANWLIKDLGIQKGDMVALDGTNSPEWMLIFYALEAIGAMGALINCNLTSQSLTHCVKLSDARYVLADAGLQDLVAPVESDLAREGIKTVYYSPEFFQTLKDRSPIPPGRGQGIAPTDTAYLIYTSGTTGLPKGTIITRAREVAMTLPQFATRGQMVLNPGDRMYTPLPML